MENKETFEYTYSAKDQEEIERIKRKYIPKEADKMELLRKMDRDVTKPGTMWAIIVGTIGCLIFGIGMSLTLVWTDSLLVVGIILGLIGIAIMAAALPIYNKITEKERERIAPQILSLTEELSK